MVVGTLFGWHRQRRTISRMGHSPGPVYELNKQTKIQGNRLNMLSPFRSGQMSSGLFETLNQFVEDV